jgi:VanZ family protein
MYKPGYGNTLFVLHAVLTVAAAVTILVLSVMPALTLSSGTSANSGPVPQTVFVLSVMPPLSLSSGTPANSGPVLHIIAYSTLCFLTCMWLRVAGTMQFPIFRAIFFTSLYGLFIECVQFGVPYRSFEASDILINCLAAATAIIPCYAMIRLVPLYKKTEVQEATSRLN